MMVTPLKKTLNHYMIAYYCRLKSKVHSRAYTTIHLSGGQISLTDFFPLTVTLRLTLSFKPCQ